MELTFCGWEVTYDDDPSRGELKPTQKPKYKGVYTMYHGTSVASARLIIANGFRQSSSGMLGKGVYVSRDKSKACCYPIYSADSDRVVFKLRVRTGRVKRIDKDNHPMQYTWNSQGYDTAWVPPRCGWTAVRSGREEDCVFDPNRVEVVGIAKAPNDTIQEELERLLSDKASRHGGGGFDGAADVCSVCKTKTQQSSPHIKQQCWECGQTICILMKKHYCPARP